MRMIDGMRIKGIGDRTRDGLLEITDTRWDGNGSLYVTVRETMGGHCLVGGFPVRRARTLARGALMYPEHTRQAPVVRHVYDQGCEHVTFKVSRHA